MRRALVLLTAVGLLVTACASGTEGTPTAAGRAKTTSTTSTSEVPFDGEVLGDGEVVRVEKLDGIRLESPDDGRLRNYGVGVDVVDFGTADIVDGGDGYQYGAGDDSTLLAFRLRVATFADDAGEKVKATVSVDGRQRSLPDFESSIIDPGQDVTIQYVVGVPKERREVELELKYADFAQQFDLLEGKRTGTQPDILYRSDDAPYVYVENLTPAKLPLTDEAGATGAYIVTATLAQLSYFSPNLGDVPSTTDKAWLVVVYEPSGEGLLDSIGSRYACAVPYTSYTLADGEGASYPVVEKHSSVKDTDDAHTLVFEVPADLGDATLTMPAGPFSCTNSGTQYLYTATAEAKVEMTLPQD